MKTSSRPFGALADGTPVTAYTLENSRGMAVTVIDYGATVQALLVPNKKGGLTDVALGYDTAAEYEAGDGFLGAAIGRVGNRIGGARFSLNGVEYTLAKNDGENCLHGGVKGFDKRMWTGAIKGDALVFSRLSPDGEENFPGNLDVTVTYTLTEDGVFTIAYDAVCDKDTILNLANHTYFNLNGGGSVLDHELMINAERFCESDAGCLPTGKLLDVEGTPFDFRESKIIGRDLGADCEQLRCGHGYDHNYVLSGKTAAVLYSAESGIELTVETDMPGMQFYTSNGLTQRKGKGGRPMGVHGAVCLETQLFPNGMNCWTFPSPVLRAGVKARTATSYRFAVR